MISLQTLCFLTVALGLFQAFPAHATDRLASPPAAAPADENAGARIQLNFRNAPLDAVLQYLSDAAGFIIVPHTGGEPLKGTITVWSDQPVTREEAFQLLNSALNQNGYAAVRTGRTLAIYTKEEALKQNVPVQVGRDLNDIPRTDRMVTQVIPLHFVDATQLLKDLEPLKPDGASWLANQGANALLITDTEVDIRRVAAIVNALDTSVTSISAVRVFSLKYADAEGVASLLKDLFAPDTSASDNGNSNSRRSRFRRMLRNLQAASAAAQSGRVVAAPVVAVADDHSNSVIVSASEDQMPVIEDVIHQLDTDVQDITELRVFHLKNADAQETADLLMDLFTDSDSVQGLARQFRFSGGRGRSQIAALLRSRASSGSTESSRTQEETQVTAVPDPRTDSVVVSASHDLMPEIADVINDLDADPSNKQEVFVFNANHADPASIEEILQGLFPPVQNGTTSSGRASQLQQNGPGLQLDNRARQLQNQGYNSNSSRSGGLGMGLGGGLGGR